MKNRIKTIAVIGLMVVIGFCVTGCGSKNQNTATPAKTNTTVNQSTSTQNRANMANSIKRRNEILDRRIQQNPNDYRAYTQRALNKMRQHDYQGASEDINTALQINPNDKIANSIKRQIEKRQK
ncbi:hypothetical protein IJS77_02075 [bacterium]|nr:hypothetical protein [bacterium]